MGPLTQRRGVFPAGVWLLLAAGATPVPATPAIALQGRLERAAFHATVRADSGDARVRIEYIVVAGGGSVDVPVSILLFDGTPVRNIVTRLNGVALDPELRSDVTGLRWRGAVPLGTDSAADRAAAGAAGASGQPRSVRIEVEYDVAVPPDIRAGPVRLPILAVMWPPSAALPGTFRAEVEVAADLRLHDAFPAGLRRDMDFAGQTSPSTSRHVVDLPVVPAMVAFTLAPAHENVVTMANVLDVFVLLAIAVIWTFMWRQFRRETR